MPHAAPHRAPVLVAVVHGVLNAQRFESIADLADAVKRAAARARIPYDADGITAAIAFVEHSRAIVHPPPAPAPAVAPPLTHEQSLAALRAVRARLGLLPPIKPMPHARLVTRSEADRYRAFQMLAREIAETAARCDALERDTPEGER